MWLEDGVVADASLNCCGQQNGMCNNGMGMVFRLCVCVHVSLGPYDKRRTCGRSGRQTEDWQHADNIQGGSGTLNECVVVDHTAGKAALQHPLPHTSGSRLP